MYGTDFDVSKLRVFGNKSFVHVEGSSRRKFDPKARQGRYVGFEPRNSCHKVFVEDTKRAIETIHVVFDENLAALESASASAVSEEAVIEPPAAASATCDSHHQ